MEKLRDRTHEAAVLMVGVGSWMGWTGENGTTMLERREKYIATYIIIQHLFVLCMAADIGRGVGGVDGGS